MSRVFNDLAMVGVVVLYLLSYSPHPKHDSKQYFLRIPTTFYALAMKQIYMPYIYSTKTITLHPVLARLRKAQPAGTPRPALVWTPRMEKVRMKNKSESCDDPKTLSDKKKKKTHTHTHKFGLLGFKRPSPPDRGGWGGSGAVGGC